MSYPKSNFRTFIPFQALWISPTICFARSPAFEKSKSNAASTISPSPLHILVNVFIIAVNTLIIDTDTPTDTFNIVKSAATNPFVKLPLNACERPLNKFEITVPIGPVAAIKLLTALAAPESAFIIADPICENNGANLSQFA